MKSTFRIVFFTMISSLVMMSCQKKKDSEDISRVTNYPTFVVKGEDPIFVEKGTPYNEPGVIATENGKEIDVTTSVVGHYRGGKTLDVNVPDYYTITYSATNKDGFEGSVTRDVYVAETGDLVNSIAGLYTSTVVRNGSSGAAYTNMKYILIWDEGNNVYGISDGIGGYYDIGRGYGYNYAAPTTVTANDISANDFSYTTYPVKTFGGTVTMSGMKADPANNTLSFTAAWDAGYTFEVTLKQVQF